MDFLRRLVGGSEPHSVPADSTAWLLKPRADAVLDIVGEQSYQDALRKLGSPFDTEGPTSVDHIALLVPEPENRYDRNAIRVQIKGLRVGYLSRENAGLYGPVVRWTHAQGRPLAAEARLTGGWNRGAGDVGTVGVKLHVGTPAETMMELLGDSLTMRSDHRWVGLMVAFTGDSQCRVNGMRLDRASSELLARRAGLTVHPRVTKSVRLLVDCDPTGTSGNEGRALEYGIEVVSEAAFWTELGLQVDQIEWGARSKPPDWGAGAGR